MNGHVARPGRSASGVRLQARSRSRRSRSADFRSQLAAALQQLTAFLVGSGQRYRLVKSPHSLGREAGAGEEVGSCSRKQVGVPQPRLGSQVVEGGDPGERPVAHPDGDRLVERDYRGGTSSNNSSYRLTIAGQSVFAALRAVAW